ncbi:hypothetical protein KFL_012900010 [Klebsormidium nitens]|uniref:Uncharacterized protein n=1 Tax=Klebsormidium nitens TaxID=105231 RepID=A0A1Y1IQ90_KLENI|nr:hypothetical protein KFL_012900010 [Klebsormidium nitens]|eukprot:GAQ93085.1 hypothetical protein KFL_012900010 [Klebsormidium nitens]
MHDWRVFSEKEVTSDGRVVVAVLASFVEELSRTASLPEPGSAEGPANSKWYSRCKRISDLFGASKGRGHGVLQPPAIDSKYQGLEGRTVSIEDATVYVFNEWLERGTWAETSIQMQTWKEQREAWASEGLSTADQLRREGEAMADMLRALPVFVVRGLSGAYYSETQLKYATGTNAHPFQLYQMLRDSANRKGREGAVGTPDEEREDDVGAKDLGWRPLGDRDEESEFEVAEEVEGEGVSKERLIRAIGYEVPGAAEPQGGGVGARERALAAPAGGASAVTLRVGLGDLCAADRTPEAFAKIVVRSAVSQGLGVQGAMRRAVWQYQAVGRDHVALRREFLKILATVIEAAPELPIPEAPGPAAAGAGGPRSATANQENADVDSEGTETDLEGESEIEESESEEGGSESEDSGSVDLEKEEEEEIGGSLFYEKAGRETTGKAPVKGLGDMGRGFWEAFRIPGEAVMMASKYNAEIAEKFKAKHNLWLLSVLSRFFPTTIPFPTPDHEVLFSENLVGRALPEAFDEPGRNMMNLVGRALPEAFDEPGRNMMVEALYVSEGLPVDKTGYASSQQLMNMVVKLRGSEWELGEGLTGGGESGAAGTGGESEMQAFKRARAEFRQDAGVIAEHEAMIEQVKAKRGKF